MNIVDAACADHITAYLGAGLALVPIPAGRKGPTDRGWNLPENSVRTPGEAATRLTGGCNIGLAHAYSDPPTCAIDVDDIDLARPWLVERGIDLDAMLAASDAVRIESGREGRAKLLYRLPAPMVIKMPPGSGLELRCASANGSSMQDVLPPSVHPDTGKPYRLIGDIARIPPIPEPLFALWQALGRAEPRKQKLEQAKIDDPILKALNATDMVVSDQGGGKIWIECPFADQHSSDTGPGQTVYYLPHTNGYAQGHFHCLHAHCADRQDVEFLAAIYARYAQEVGPPPFALASVPPPVTKPQKGDADLAWLIAHAPAVVRDYVGWYMANAVRPHEVFSLVSALLFVQAVIGRNVALPRGTRANLWFLLLAPTESGKGDVPRLATEAMEQLHVKGILPAIPCFEQAFGSAEAIWWHLESMPQGIWFDEELAKTLAGVIAATEGSPRYALRRALLVLYDAASKARIEPIRYSKRTRSAQEMLPLNFPYLTVAGTGVISDISRFAGAASDDGLLNRFLVFTMDALPVTGSIDAVGPLPHSVIGWAGKLHLTGALEAMNTAAGKVRELPAYEGFTEDWRKESDYGSELAQALPGIWGRYAEKVLKVAMLHAMVDGGSVTPQGFAWAKRLVRWVNASFAVHFAAEGGGAENEMDALALAFMQAFDAPALKGMDAIQASQFARYAGRAWRKCQDGLKRRRVIEALTQDGRIEEVGLLPKGTAYRKLQDA